MGGLIFPSNEKSLACDVLRKRGSSFVHHNKVKNGTCPYIPTIRFLQAFSLAGGHLLSGLPGLRANALEWTR